MRQYVQTDLEVHRQVATTLAELIIGGVVCAHCQESPCTRERERAPIYSEALTWIYLVAGAGFDPRPLGYEPYAVYLGSPGSSHASLPISADVVEASLCILPVSSCSTDSAASRLQVRLQKRALSCEFLHLSCPPRSCQSLAVTACPGSRSGRGAACPLPWLCG
jgi:hypothetical protein